MFGTAERDGAAMGRAAGAMLADVLLQLADGAAPAGPRASSRVGKEMRQVSFLTHAEAGTWLQMPGLVDAVVVDVRGDEVRVLVPALGGGTSFDVVWSVRYAIDGAGIATSEPAFMVADGMDELLDDLNDGIAAGLERHPFTSRLKDGFGALGPYDG